MSAGGLSYSAITNNGKVNLPSVEAWSSNLNILRDPPKSIMTRRIDKVGDTNSITQEIEDSGNRNCEAIQVYARGVNPFVSVSYSNHGNNGGQGGVNPSNLSGSSSNGIFSGNVSAKLPRTILKDGAFRPPRQSQRDLIPLSRLPRNLTSAFSKPEMIDFSRKLRTCGTAENTKEINTKKLKACIRPTAVYKIEKPISEPFEIKYVIQPTIKVSANSGIRTMDITQQESSIPVKEIDNNPLHAHAQANYTHNRHVNNSTLYTDKYLQDTNAHSVNTQFSDNNNYVSHTKLNTDKYLQDVNAHSVNTQFSDNNNYVNHTKINTDKYLQDTNVHSVASNFSSNKYYSNVEDILDLSDIPVQNTIITSANAPFSGLEKTEYFHDDISMARKLPEYKAETNIGQNIYKRLESNNKIELGRNTPITSFTSNIKSNSFNDNNSRKASLAPKINAGSYSIPAQIPSKDRMQQVKEYHDTEKSKINRIISENMQGRR